MDSLFVTNNTLQIFDPELNPDTWCSITLDNVIDGEWKVFLKNNEIESYKKGYKRLLDWSITDHELGIDSGQINLKSCDNCYEVVLWERQIKIVAKKEVLKRKNMVYTVFISRNKNNLIVGVKITP